MSHRQGRAADRHWRDYLPPHYIQPVRPLSAYPIWNIPASMSRTISVAEFITRLWAHLTPRRKVQLVLLLGWMFVGALAELVSLGSVLPFLGVLVAPESVLNRPAVAGVAQYFGIETPQQLILPVTVGFVIAILAAGMVRLSLLWANSRISLLVGVDLSSAAYLRTLYQPYRVHVARNSSEVISGIVNKVGMTINALFQFLTLSSSAIILAAVLLALFAIDALVATISIVGFGLIYGTIMMLVRHRLAGNSVRVAQEETAVIKLLNESLGGIRDVILDGTQSLYCELYRRTDAALRYTDANSIFMASSPRFAVESLGMVLIVVLAYILSGRQGGITSALPVLGALALGAQRLIPALQQCYTAWSAIIGRSASVCEVLDLLDQPLPEAAKRPIPSPMTFTHEIRFESVSFRYGETLPMVLDGVDLTIPRGSRIGLIGATGSGKSTAMDLLMGLLDSTTGRITVDSRPIDAETQQAWQRNIAHVPQAIYLADTSIAENIAFGVSRDFIDLAMVRRAAEQAQLAGFVDSLPLKFETHVGERGVRLSGGQRQRIGIARALYKQASVLIFDEATSALDNETEKDVMDAIDGLGRELTIVIIAHRLTTVRRCDRIVRFEKGKIAAEGSYEAVVRGTVADDSVPK